MTLAIFPVLAGVTYPTTKTPIWQTDVQISVSGKRTTLARQAYPRYAFELPYSFLRSTVTKLELQELMAFFNTVQGKANLFRYNDPTDYSVTAQAFGTGDGSTVDFQLVRTMLGTSNSWVDPVFYPVTSAIYNNGVLVSSGDYDITNGLVTFDTAPTSGHALTWTGTFDWLCRLDNDSADFARFMESIWELKSIKFSSEKIA